MSNTLKPVQKTQWIVQFISRAKDVAQKLAEWVRELFGEGSARRRHLQSRTRWHCISFSAIHRFSDHHLLARSQIVFRYIVLTAALASSCGQLIAQPRLPGPSPIDGRWFFRGNPFSPCSIQTIATPMGKRLVFTNENGTPAEGWLSKDGKRVTIPDWNLIGKVRGNEIVWPNGDFWGR